MSAASGFVFAHDFARLLRDVLGYAVLRGEFVAEAAEPIAGAVRLAADTDRIFC